MRNCNFSQIIVKFLTILLLLNKLQEFIFSEIFICFSPTKTEDLVNQKNFSITDYDESPV